MDKEEWKPVSNNPPYEVSPEGNVRNSKTGRVLSPYVSDNGYEEVNLYNKDSQKWQHKKVRNLVGEVYVPGRADGLCLINKDGNKLHSSADNLEWGTRKDVTRIMYENGYSADNLKKPIRCIETGKTYESISACAKELGVSRTTISRCINNVSKNNLGYTFELIK